MLPPPAPFRPPPSADCESLPAPGRTVVVLSPSPSAPRTRLYGEIGVILAVAVVPDIVNALWGVASQTSNADGFGAFGSASLAARSLAVCAVAAFIMTTSTEGVRAFGVVRPRFWADAGLGFLAFVTAYAAGAVAAGYTDAWLGWMWKGLGADGGWTTPESPLVAIGPMVMNSFAEEVAIWGVLHTRLRRLGAREVPAILLPALAFASYHVYYDAGGIAWVLGVGLAHGLMFRVCGRLWPLVISHTLHGMIASAMLT